MRRQPNPDKPHVTKRPTGDYVVSYENMTVFAKTCKGAVPAIAAMWKKFHRSRPPFKVK